MPLRDMLLIHLPRTFTRKVLAAVVGSLTTAALAGCGLGPGAAPAGVRVSITEDFGGKRLLALNAPKVGGAETVMRLLMRNTKVDTEYSGGFVSSINGHSEGHEYGKPFDWFYYVNGEEAEKGAAETTVHSGDRIWWDLHDWSQSQEVPAVVGSFPAPFTTGLGGKRLPVTIECARPHSSPCHEISHRLSALGVLAGFAALGTVGEASEANELKVQVGTWAQLADGPAAQAIERGPATGGVYVRILGDGSEFALLSKDGAVAEKLGAGSGLIAATRYSGSAPVWVVSGTDAKGVQRAADAFDAGSLDGHFAVAIPPSGAAGRVVAMPAGG